ncbi:hypothetical protein PTSG_12451 [Salpingoeca rosetta]|uniref:Sulfotransferase domain-containing protein n=1 Tax=Salpingoeca rosetta (strain ATCC 50818 / BSB-021) TaxID=946362 RepID=F2UG36_SALR5|nr:uncharacterized protein PTSG_12451 [Salpingoeca rosetta]EGD75464.1 hypothetical protein PTSG_12451 [Salpingoeca rosetta]|eukprot:XP_004991921.1 hypothetical protein PTSG_12451 [Salpingoeca rosetta]
MKTNRAVGGGGGGRSMGGLLLPMTVAVAAAVMVLMATQPTPAHAEDDMTFISDLPTCTDARKKFVYIKTHKTGSSTIANMFHRFANKYGLHLALPKDNTFYAWPMLDKSRILNSIWDYDQSKTFDGLCSAHVRYAPDALDKLVPNAAYVTVLRSPVTHVKSSWSYWGVANHIRANGGPTLTLDKFMENPNKYWSVANRGDRILLLNSQAYDLGLSNEPSKSQVENLIKTLEKRFFVLITDHMDESLVMMKRMFCWETEDILYISLKSHSHRKPDTSAATRIRNERIVKMNWADQMLFDHFNQTLFKLIEEETGFAEELAYFKERKKRLSEYCRRYSGYDEIAHRVQIEEKKHIGEQDRMCHLVMMDSQSFSKHFKWKEGGDPSVIECLTQGYPRKTAILARVDGVSDGVVANMLLNTGLDRDLALAIPRDTPDPSKSDIRQQFLTPKTRGGKKTTPINILVGREDVPLRVSAAGPFVDRQSISIAVVRDPAQRFVDLWDELDMDTLLDGTSMEDYLKDPNAFKGKVPEAAQLRLHNGMARSLGYEGKSLDVSEAEGRRAAMRIASTFSFGLVADHWFESMLYMRRLLCWSRRDVEYIAHPNNPNVPKGVTVDALYPERKIPASLRTQILAVNTVDAALYKQFNTTLWRKLTREMQMRDEVDVLKAHLRALLDTCESVILKTPSEIADLAQSGSGSERRCARLLSPVDKLYKVAQNKKPSRWVYE